MLMLSVLEVNLFVWIGAKKGKIFHFGLLVIFMQDLLNSPISNSDRSVVV